MPISLLMVPLLLTGCMGSRDLTSEEIRKLLSGARVEGSNVARGYDFVREYDDGSFRQITPDGAKAKWWLQGNLLCIQWEKEPQPLCRTVRTNDRGDYWKVLRKRGGGYKTVVVYDSIVDASEGINRAVWGNPVMAILRIVFGPIGWTIIILGGIAFAIWKATRPTRLTAGGKSYLPAELEAMSPKKVDAFAHAALDERSYKTARGVYEVMIRQSRSISKGFARIWACVAPLSDAAAIAALAEILRAGPRADDLLKEVGDDTRATYLVGRGYAEWAESVRRTHDATGFNTARQGAMTFLGELREQPAPESKAEEKSTGATDYLAVAGPAFETVMYLQHDTPPDVASGDSE